MVWKNIKYLPFLKFLLLIIFGYIVIFSISLFAGTNKFNELCLEALSNKNSESFLHYGFSGCKVNTLTFDTIILFNGICILLYVLYASLIVFFNKRKISRNISLIIVAGTLILILVVISEHIFQSLSLSPLEVRYSTNKTPYYSNLLINSLKFIKFESLIWISIFMVSFFAGPLAVNILINKLRITFKSKLLFFIAVFFGSVLAEITIFSTVFGIINNLKIFPNKAPKVNIGQPEKMNTGTKSLELNYPTTEGTINIEQNQISPIIINIPLEQRISTSGGVINQEQNKTNPETISIPLMNTN